MNHEYHEGMGPQSFIKAGIRILCKGDSGRDYAAEAEARRKVQRDAFYKGTNYYAGADDRQAQYDAMSKDIVTSNSQRFDDEYAKAEKNVRMNMARAGLSGSSEEAYQLAELKKNYDRGMTDIGSNAEGAVAGAKSAYEQAITQGVQSINSGSQAATEIASALSKVSAAMQAALEGAKGASYSGFFDSLGSAVEQNQFRTAAATGMNKTAGKADEKSVAAIGGSGGGSGYSFNPKA